ncbi:MFS transporter [Blastococcus sp. TF02A_35]|uniref:MFS transporter n=1 Tax=Blastococcus sp. TF02A-35 TaxID=2559612 RepID=UPI001073D4E6|nr:MFS transporter [Blastococcus sp. TF02A_35]TFV48487.1 MFS transporter [Blastococcus sp. TF02A_35]
MSVVPHSSETVTARVPVPRLSPEGHDPQSTVRVPVTGPLRRLLVWYGVASLGVYLALGAVNSVLLPLQVEAVDPAQKAANLAIVTAVGAVGGMVAQPIAGLLSDRTRSRWGRRAPWIFTGALLAAGAMVVLGGMTGLVGIGALYLLVMVSLNIYFSPKAAVMPDRVPRGVRGLFSASGGLGVLVGITGGMGLGAVLSGTPAVGYSVLAVVIVLAAGGFALFNPDHDNRGEPRPPLQWTAFLRTFWVSPRQHPDFAWGFLGRLLTLTGYYITTTFQLYVLQDHIGLGDDAVDAIPLISVVSLLSTLVSTVVGGPLSDRMGRRKPVAVAAGLLIAAGLVAPWVMPTMTGIIVFAVLAGLGFGSYLAVDQALLTEVLPTTEDNGRYLGVLNIAVTLPQALAPAIAGLIVSVLSYAALFPIAMVVAVAGALAVLPIRSVR